MRGTLFLWTQSENATDGRRVDLQTNFSSCGVTLNEENLKLGIIATDGRRVDLQTSFIQLRVGD